MKKDYFKSYYDPNCVGKVSLIISLFSFDIFSL